jgi:hypothetical protein
MTFEVTSEVAQDSPAPAQLAAGQMVDSFGIEEIEGERAACCTGEDVDREGALVQANPVDHEKQHHAREDIRDCDVLDSPHPLGRGGYERRRDVIHPG